MTVTGPDLSSYQSTINLQAIKNAGHSFVIVKATDGTGYVNPYFVAQSQAARTQGLVTSAYHFMQPGNGAGQAAHFLATINGRIDPAVRVWADFEGSSHDDLHAFTMAVQAAGRPVGIYTGGWYWQPHGNASCAHCAGLPLWQSAYQPNQPRPFSPWSTAAMWQYTDVGVIPGWAGGVDLSIASDISVLLPQVADMTPDESARLLRVEQNLADLASFIKWAFHPNADGPNGVDFTRTAFTTSGELGKTLRGLPTLIGANGQVDVVALASHLQTQLNADQAAALAAHLTISPK